MKGNTQAIQFRRSRILRHLLLLAQNGGTPLWMLRNHSWQDPTEGRANDSPLGTAPQNKPKILEDPPRSNPSTAQCDPNNPRKSITGTYSSPLQMAKKHATWDTFLPLMLSFDLLQRPAYLFPYFAIGMENRQFFFPVIQRFIRIKFIKMRDPTRIVRVLGARAVI